MSGILCLSYRQLLFTSVAMITAILLTLDVGSCSTQRIGSVPVKMIYTDIYRVRSRSFIPTGVFYIAQGVSDIQCYARCLMSTRCLSVNYKKVDQSCEMSNMTVNTASVSLVYQEGYHYMDKVDIPIGLMGKCVSESSDSEQSCGIPSSSCPLTDRANHIIEQTGNVLLAHSSCRINGQTEICDTSSNTWRPHTPNCAGLPPSVRSNASYTIYADLGKAVYDCLDGDDYMHVTFSRYDELTRTWSQPDIDCTPFPSDENGPSALSVPSMETFVLHPYRGVESFVEDSRVNGDNTLALHRCKVFNGSQPVKHCPVSRRNDDFTWSAATLSCSEKDCLHKSSERYEGRVSCTVGSIPCQRWDTNFPHEHEVFSGRSDLENYCQATSGTPQPWCYTTDGNRRWDYCPMVDCQ